MEGRQDNDDSDSEAQPRPDVRFVSRNRLGNVNMGRIVINMSGKGVADADCQYPVVRAVAKELRWRPQLDPHRVDWDVWWTDNAIPPQTLFRMLPHQKINHFPGRPVVMEACT